MKWIFYIVLLANLGLAAWLVNTPSEKTAIPITSPRDVGDLKIVSDVELQVRADFQKKLEKEQKSGVFSENVLPKVEFDDFVFDEDDNKRVICRQLGPFSEKKHAEDIASGLAAYRLPTKIVTTTIRDIKGYWAILPAPATRQEANELVEKLRDKGVVDVRRFVVGDLENSISLGMFSSEGNAKKRARSIEELGFVAVVTPNADEKELYWLEYMQPEGFKLPIKSVRVNYPEAKIKACPGIASG